ncbi:GIY-YIG nuclease family protein [Alienimonas sp. DA493]|uniref:GIY-YIG nuclease family protein n=1 Tax=Alienimonas sp. DA493 TaxID=3373605 RepID=UPI00375506FB
MQIHWQPEPFAAFGPNPFAAPGPPAPLHVVEARRKKDLKERMRAACPRRPGVYGMVDTAGRLIYVGKSKSLRTRLLSYFGKSAEGEKAAKIIRETRTLVWEETGTDFASLLRELQLIRTWRPRWNVKDQPRSRRPRYLCVGRGPARCVFVTTTPPKDAVAFGPFRGRRTLTTAAEALNHHFGLRDCTGKVTLHWADQAELFPTDKRPGCLRIDLGTCLGPCAGACTRKAYAEREEACLRWLRGLSVESDGPDPAGLLAERMARAAREMRFETAAKLRDAAAAVEWLAAKLHDLRTVRETFHFVYPTVAGRGREKNRDAGGPEDGRRLWYLIERGHVAAVVHDPVADRRRRRPAERLLAAWVDDGRLLPRHHIPPHPTVNLTGHWFRTKPAELEGVMTPAEALEACRSGFLPERKTAPVAA